MSFESLLERAEASSVDLDLNDRYDGTRQLDSLGLNIPPVTRVLEMATTWPQLVVDTMAEVLVVEGFECAAEGTDPFLKRVWELWAASNMGVSAYLAQVEALVQGSSFLIVGLDRGGRVFTTVRSRGGVAVDYVDGRVASALVRYQATTEQGTTVERATYYTGTTIETFQQAGGLWGKLESASAPGYVPVVPLVNKYRVGDTAGRSEISLVSGFADAAARALTLLQLSMELLSMPQRWIAGGDMSKFKRADGTSPTLADLYLGSYMFAPTADAKMGQFPGADLSQIVNVIETLARQVSATTGIPMQMFGFTSAGNPMSAEAMRAAKERFISRGERKQALFGEAYTQWARIALAYDAVARGRRVDIGRLDESLSGLEVAWRDIAFPSVAAKNQAVLQAHAQGIVSGRTAREQLPLTVQQKRREDMADAAEGDVIMRAAGKRASFKQAPAFKDDPDAVTAGNEDKAAVKGGL